MDGAVMPRSLGVNPLLTITALAERAMLHLARDWGLACDDVPTHGTAPAPVSVAELE
jgi:cholesterol oxidase